MIIEAETEQPYLKKGGSFHFETYDHLDLIGIWHDLRPIKQESRVAQCDARVHQPPSNIPSCPDDQNPVFLALHRTLLTLALLGKYKPLLLARFMYVCFVWILMQLADKDHCWYFFFIRFSRWKTKWLLNWGCQPPRNTMAHSSVVHQAILDWKVNVG